MFIVHSQCRLKNSASYNKLITLKITALGKWGSNYIINQRIGRIRVRLKRTLESYGGRKIREEEKRLLSARLPTIQDKYKTK